MSDNINPDHYKLAGGAEVIDITEALNFNGGNAVKYIARSCRIDGVFKGKRVEDLYKARWYIERELGRLGRTLDDDEFAEAVLGKKEETDES